MGRTTPDFWFGRVTEIGADFLRTQKIAWLALDIDNTLTLPNTDRCAPGVPEWIGRLRQAGIALVLVSNNREERVKAAAAAIGLPFVWRAGKPFASGLRRAAKLAGLPLERGGLIGDQLFTDVGAAKSAHIPALLVDPLTEDTEWFICLKRRLERRFTRANLPVREKTRALTQSSNPSGTAPEKR